MTDLEKELELERRAAAEKLAREQLDSDLSAMLSEPAGRRVLEHIVFNLAGLQSLSHDHTDRQSAFNEGQRAVAVALNNSLERANVDRWAQMHFERLERRRLVQRDPKPNKTDH